MRTGHRQPGRQTHHNDSRETITANLSLYSLAAMGDHPTALALYAAIATGLFLREKTGKGRVVSTSLLANGIWSFGSVLQGKLDGADIQPPKPRHAPALPTFNSYKCGCGRWINLSILNEKLLKPACEILGCPEAADDPRFSTYDARRENAEAMVKIFDPLFAKFDRDDLMKKFDAAGVGVHHRLSFLLRQKLTLHIFTFRSHTVSSQLSTT